MKCSMIAPRMAGLSCCHSPSALVTVMKSEPKNTPVDARRCRTAARPAATCGVFLASEYRACRSGKTARPGRNFRVAGFGVASV